MSVAAAPARTLFFMVANEVVDDYGLNPYEMTVYNAIVRHINYKTNIAKPSISRLMALTHLARPTVIKYTRELEKKRLIRVQRGCIKGSKQRAVNQYEILAPSPYLDGSAPTPHEAEKPRAGDSSNRELPPIPAEAGSKRDELPLVHPVYYPGKPDEPPLVNAVNRNETPLNEMIPDEIQTDDRGPALRAGSRLPDGSAAPRRTPPPMAQKLKRSESWELFCHTLADVCKIDFEANQGRIRKTASPLWRKGDGYRPEDLRAFEWWWRKNDWRGKKGETPRLRDVTECIRAAIEVPGSPTETSEDIRIRYTRGEYADIIHY